MYSEHLSRVAAEISMFVVRYMLLSTLELILH